MPTGGGKSVCYQIPALIMSGCAIVVSPLIALMEDQVAYLKSSGYPAESLNSFKSESENLSILDRASTGELKLIYTSPERLLSLIDRLPESFPFSFMAIDEAHCISQWGHDFRPDYKDLAKIRHKFTRMPVLALTATADAVTRDDIEEKLEMKNTFRHVSSFDRPNISLNVVPSPGKKGKISLIRQLANKYPNDCGIVYCLSRNTTEDVTKSLNDIGIHAECYHAGLTQQQRTSVQEKFINGNCKIIVATVAFGMGIDKSNIRWIVHYNMPANIESYYQEVGRSGRDGLPAETYLFYSYQDVILRENLIAESDHSEVFRHKLNFMKDFAEARVCRRRILLSYFNEEYTHNCGNCDVCKNPPEFFDGTIAAQKAMSAIIRGGGRMAMNTISDVLLGHLSANVKLSGLQYIPTFGVGREYRPIVWRSLIGQMVQLGILESHINDHGKMSVTPYGRRVLTGQESIRLVMPDETHTPGRAKSASETGKRVLTPEENLFEQLRNIRREISLKENLKEFMICNDASLMDMVAKHPLSLESFKDIQGIGEIKAVKYWKKFVGAIRKFDGLTATDRGGSLKETLLLHNSGYKPTDIAKIKGVKLQTIYGHIAELINEGLITNYERLITSNQLEVYITNRDKENWFEIVDDILPDGMWRVAKAIAEKTDNRRFDNKH